MANIYSHQDSNVRTTWIIMTVFLVVIVGIGFLLAVLFHNPVILYGSIGLSLLMNIASYWFSDKMVLSMSGATPISSRDEYPDLWSTVENLSTSAGLPMPKLYVIDDPAPNAFATGRNKDNAVIAVTTGLLPLLNKSELEGVIAHELSHIGNRDILLQTVVVVFAGALSMIAQMALQGWGFNSSQNGDGEKSNNPFVMVLSFVGIILAPLAATLLKLAISREREFLADASGASLTRYPEGLASALQKIANFHQPMRIQNTAIAHLFISHPSGVNDESELREGEKVSFFQKMLMTHPPTEERVKRLLSSS